MSARMSDPLVVVTRDAGSWWKRAVDPEGHGLYARSGCTDVCPELWTIRELAAFGLTGMTDTAPVGPRSLSAEVVAEQLDFLHRVTLPDLRRSVEHHEAGKARWRARAEKAEARVAELEAERHVTNEALDDAVQELREREQRDAAVAGFVAARAEYITAIRNCHPDNGHDYDRWQGHAAARRQLAELLGLPVAWPAETGSSVQKSADKLAALLAPTQALRVPDGEHYAAVHHSYLLGHDLPETGGAK